MRGNVTYLEPGWSVLAVFVMLVLVYKNVSCMQAVHRPRDILKKTWGESFGHSLGPRIIKFERILAVKGIAV